MTHPADMQQLAPAGPTPAPAGRQAGFTLIEALVAMMIVAMVVIQYIGVRTTALIDATQARNWRLAREIAEEKMSELRAGARELPPESGEMVTLDKYEGFSFKIVIGEAAVAELESELATSSAGEDAAATERLEWQRDREDYRRASSKGLSYSDYQDKLAEDDYRRRMEEKAPSADEFEEVAVAVYFPKLNAEYEGEKDSMVIKAHLSTLALSGMTPAQAEAVAKAKGQATDPNAPAAAPGNAAAGGGPAGSSAGNGTSPSGSTGGAKR